MSQRYIPSKCQNLCQNSMKINQKTRLIYDACYNNQNRNQSTYPGDYSISNYHSCKCKIPEVKKLALEQPGYAGLQFKDGFGWTSMLGCNIDEDSRLRNAKNLTNLRCINQLSERPYKTVPYMGRGVGNPCQESMLVPGEDTYQEKPCNNLSGRDLTDYRLTPMVPCLKKSIQNEKHIIEEENGWVRSGVPSRQLIRNRDYLEKCGYKLKGKNWVKNN